MHVPIGRPADEWLAEGAIVFKDVWMRYRPELDPVLKGFSFSVAAGDKIGIVERTGSGKSFLNVALFGIVEPYKVRRVALSFSQSVTAQVQTGPHRLHPCRAMHRCLSITFAPPIASPPAVIPSPPCQNTHVVRVTLSLTH